MKKKFFYTLVSIILCLLLTTGCWDRRELNMLGIVLAAGLDIDEKTGEYILTTQMVRPAALKQEGGSQQPPVELVNTRGATIQEAVKNISKEFDKIAFFPHNQVLVISEKFARQGIMPIINFYRRDYEMRNLINIIIAKDTKPEEILSVKHGIENVQGTYLAAITRNNIMSSEVTTITIFDFVKKLIGSGINPTTGVMEVIEESASPKMKKEENKEIVKGIKLSGTAIFKKDKLVGYLSDKETRGFNWVTGNIKTGIINVPPLTKKGKIIAIRILRVRSNIKPEINNGNLFFIINIKQESVIIEQQSPIDTSNPELLAKLEKEQEKIIKKEIEMAITKAQKKYKSDIFGFGSTLSRSYPKEWEKIKKQWVNIFPDVKYMVTVKTRIKRTGLLQKPLKPME